MNCGSFWMEQARREHELQNALQRRIMALAIDTEWIPEPFKTPFTMLADLARDELLLCEKRIVVLEKLADLYNEAGKQPVSK